jgi:large subunit ribosomal protein L3
MVTALLGKKVGMTRVYDKVGTSLPVTVLEMGPCRVMQVKTAGVDGYAAAQFGFGQKKRTRATKPEAGHAKKAGVEPARFVREVSLDASDDVKPGQVFTVGLFKEATKVDVSGVTKGRGFQGGVKRWGFRGMGDSHGVSMVHRAPGANSSGTHMSRKWKGAKMAGHLGNELRTVKGLKVVRVVEDKNLLVVEGAVPGPQGGFVMVRVAQSGTKK